MCRHKEIIPFTKFISLSFTLCDCLTIFFKDAALQQHQRRTTIIDKKYLYFYSLLPCPITAQVEVLGQLLHLF